MGRLLHDWVAVQTYHDEGHGFVECAKKFGFSHTAWVKAIKSGRLRSKATPYRDRRRKYDWAEIRAYHEAGHTYKECAMRFGFCSKAWEGAVKVRRYSTSPHGSDWQAARSSFAVPVVALA